MSGNFIVIEGLEGAGKSTAVATITHWLKGRGIDYCETREPGGTPLAEAIREVVKNDWQEQVTPIAELLMMYAARVQLVHNVIQPALAAGMWVVGDRHDLSSRAYQGGGRELGDSTLQQLKKLTLGDFNPNLTIILDIRPELGLERAAARGELDRFERSALEFFRRTRAQYLAIAAQEANIVVIDAEQPLAQVQEQIIEVLTQRWPT